MKQELIKIMLIEGETYDVCATLYSIISLIQKAKRRREKEKRTEIRFLSSFLIKYLEASPLPLHSSSSQATVV